jgi:hypothetical protein
MMGRVLKLVSWISGTQAGRWLGWFCLSLGIALFAAIKLVTFGNGRRKAKRREAQLKTLQTRLEVDRDLAYLSADERRERLSRWMR